MEICSPDDCFVSALQPDGRVKKGDLLLSLYSPRLAQLLNRIDGFLSLLAINKRKFADGRVADFRQLQLDTHQDVKEQQKHTDALVEMTDKTHHIGGASPFEVQEAHLRTAAQRVVTRKHECLIKHVDKEIADRRDLLASMEQHLSAERQILLDWHQRLAFRAPFDGQFGAKCAMGLFYKKGQALGTLDY